MQFNVWFLWLVLAIFIFVIFKFADYIDNAGGEEMKLTYKVQMVNEIGQIQEAIRPNEKTAHMMATGLKQQNPNNEVRIVIEYNL